MTASVVNKRISLLVVVTFGFGSATRVWADRLLSAAGAKKTAASNTETPRSRKTDHPGTNKRLTFEADIVPILRTHCLKCHGAKKQESGLDLRRRFAILKGGDSGPAIVPGKPGDSLFIIRIVDGEMPPEGEPRIDAKQIDRLKKWIAAGAAITGKTERPLPATGGVSDADRRFWSFQPPKRWPVPAVRNRGRVRTPIDAFLLARLEEKGAGFNPDAPRRVLVRRVYLDLIGLPPTPRQIHTFLTDPHPDAYERLVDRLLASPRYGERWARHWLDVAGYADSDGYLEADRLRPEAWRYRDYVIRAVNSDKPFDRFVLEQIAGDELADWRRAKEITPELADNLIATGFLRTAADPTYGNYKEPLECHKVMSDTMQIVGSTFLGLTIQCARCHNHKFDPISQQDYYRLNAVFLSSYDPRRWVVSLARSIPLATDAEQQRIARRNAAVAARIKQLNAEINAVTVRYRDKSLDEQLAQIADSTVRQKVKAALLIGAKKRNTVQKQLVARYAPKAAIAEKDLAGRFPAYKTELTALRAAVSAEQKLTKPIVRLRGLMDLEGKPAAAHILIRGDFRKPGRTVTPGPPAVLVSQNDRFRIRPGYKTSGRRLALARWLVDPHNPLTVRVHINRIWAHHFGRGIVSSLANFGKTGARPSHPKLLDWLATEFIARGWSQKALHRLILTSTAYRQSSAPNPKLRQIDPDNILLGAWRPHRHEGEVVRDSVLAVAGKLHRNMFGRPIPVTGHRDGMVTLADAPAANRSSIYIIVRRKQPVTFLQLFDVPRMRINCTRRTESIVVTQSLSMLNSRFIETNAHALAERLLKQEPSDEAARLNFAYELLFGRLPGDGERISVNEFLEGVVRAELGPKFASAAETDKATVRKRAWSQLALVLLNSNEFVFVY